MTTPLALEMLLHFHTHSPDEVFPGLKPFPHDDKGVVGDIAYLIGEGLVEHVGDPEEPHYSLTGRGTAWLQMILATPLPVSQWADPRGGDAARAATADMFIEALRKLGDRPAPASSSAPTARGNAGAGFTPLAAPTVPADMTPWSGGSNPLVVPEGSTSPQHDVIVLYRNGKRSKKTPAQSVLWEHRGGDFDVMGYKAIAVNDVVPAS